MPNAIESGWLSLAAAANGAQHKMVADDAALDHAFAEGSVNEYINEQRDAAEEDAEGMDVEEAGRAEGV